MHDLAKGQAALGLDVGILCDATTGGERAERMLSGLSDICTLGVVRVPMARQPGLGDWRAIRKVMRFAGETDATILHGHGAKGGAYARLAGWALKRKGRDLDVLYTPHGGSLHYSPASLSGRVYIAAERALASLTDGLIFESKFAARTYNTLIEPPPCPVCLAPNGLYPYEFYDGEIDENAADFVFIGELRQLKGLDVLLQALAALKEGPTGEAPRLVVIGGGPDEARFKRLARRLKIARQVTFAGPWPASVGFARARCVVVPSRAESFPYVVLEAVGAKMPLIATGVGGIPEITSSVPMPLVAPGDAGALAGQMRAFLTDPRPFLERAAALRAVTRRRFTVKAMTEQIVGFYLSLRQATASPEPATVS